MKQELMDLGRAYLSLRGLKTTHFVDRQEDKFRQLLKYVWKHSSFYRDYYAGQGISERHLNEIPLNELPFTNKSMLMENFDKVVTENSLKFNVLENWLMENTDPDVLYQDRFHVLHTSGTSGRQGIFVYDKQVWRENCHKLALTVVKPELRTLSKLAYRKIKIAFIGATGGHYTGVSYARQMPSVMFETIDISINEALDKSVHELNAFKPDYIVGYCNAIALFVPYLENRQLKIKPTHIVCSGEQLTGPVAERITNAFGIKPINLYIATEGIMAYGESVSAPLHVHHDLSAIEIIDEKNRPCAVNQLGSVVLTNLTNGVLPILRYRLGDKAVARSITKEGRCEIIEKLQGRRQSPLPVMSDDWTADAIHPNVLVEFYVPGVQQFQFASTGPNSVKIRYIANQSHDQEVAKQFKLLLAQKKACNNTHFVIERTPALERGKGGKVNLVCAAA